MNDMNYKVTKKSIGILLFNPNKDKVLLVQKKCTYAYSEFVLGKYDKNNKTQLIDKFNKMTAQEKMIIASLEFEWIWYTMFMCKEKNDTYCRAFGRFYKCFLNNIKYLKTLLDQSNKNGSLIWEPPKGRKTKQESSASCAMREVLEETRYHPKSYQLIPGKKIKKQFISNGVRYIIIYYVGVMKQMESIKFNLTDKQQSGEISEIKWVSIDQLQQYNMLNDIKQSIISVCKELKRNKKYNTVIEEII